MFKTGFTVYGLTWPSSDRLITLLPALNCWPKLQLNNLACIYLTLYLPGCLPITFENNMNLD